MKKYLFTFILIIFTTYAYADVTPTPTMIIVDFEKVATQIAKITPSATPTFTPTMTFNQYKVWYKKITGMTTGKMNGHVKYTSTANDKGIEAIKTLGNNPSAVETKIAVTAKETVSKTTKVAESDIKK